MATKIRGITVEIGGDTSGLNKALKDTNKSIKDTQTQLKDVEKLLRLDPSSTELLEQKQISLAKSVEETSEKLETLYKAEQELRDAGVDENSAQFMALRREIISTESNLSDAKDAADKFSVSLEKAKVATSKVSSAAAEVAEKTRGMSQVAQGVLATVAGIGAAAVSSYADFEQLSGGVEKLFGKDYQKVIDNANKASASAGLSANEYMETVTNFSAALISSLGGNTEEAASLADMAIKDMADNANVFGSDIESIQNAYKGFSKQTFTMLDNLKLGYGGTKEEMQRLLEDAEKISGFKYDISSYSDIVNAIHVVQTEMKITGTTANESAHTISGSIEATKSSIQNLIAGLGQNNADIEALTQEVIDNVKNVAENIFPIIQNIWDNIPLGGQIAIAIAGVVAVISPIAGIIGNISGAIGGVLKIWPSIAGAGKAVIGFVAQNPVTLIIAAVAALAVAIIKNWDKIKPVLEKAWAKVKEVFENIKKKVTDVMDTVKGAVKLAINVVIGIINKLIAGLNKLIDGINKISFKAPDWVPGIGGRSMGFNIKHIGSIPMLANGGVLSSGSAIVGERGAELLTMSQGKAVVQPLDTSPITSALGDIKGLIGGGTQTIIVQSVLDGKVIGETAYKYSQNRARAYAK